MGIREESVSGNVFVLSVHIGSRPTGAVVFSGRTVRCSARKLGGGLDGLFNVLDGQPTEGGTKGFKIRSGFGNGALVDSMLEEIQDIRCLRRSRISSGCVPQQFHRCG
jgi:hypothetical protein